MKTDWSGLGILILVLVLLVVGGVTIGTLFPVPQYVSQPVESPLTERACVAGEWTDLLMLLYSICDAELVSIEADLAALESRRSARLLSIVPYPIAK